MKRGFIVLGLVFALSACSPELPAPDISPSPSPSPTPVQWQTAVKKPHSGMFGIAWDPSDTLSPLLTSNRLNREMYSLLYDGLFILDENFTPHERLCSRMTTADNTTFTIALRQDVLFHDGEPLTAHDVINSFQIARSAASPYSSRFSKVLSVTASGNNVEVVLSEPNERFAALLTFPILRAGDKSYPPAGTGPYVLSGEDDRSYLIPFSDWWRKAPLPIGHIELNAANRLEDITYLMSAGDISIVTSDINDGYAVGFSGEFDCWEYPTPTMYYVGFNTGHPLLGNSAIRQAISSAFDRKTLASTVFKGAADAVAAALPLALYDSGDGFDLVRCASLITDAGLEDSDNDGILDYPSGRSQRRIPFELRMIVDEEDIVACQTASFLADALSELGISLTLDILQRSQYTADLDNGAYDLYCSRVTLSPDFRQERWGGIATGTSIARQCEDFLEQMPIAPLVFKREYVLTHWDEVSGIKPVYGNPFANIENWTVVQ